MRLCVCVCECVLPVCVRVRVRVFGCVCAPEEAWIGGLEQIITTITTRRAEPARPCVALNFAPDSRRVRRHRNVIVPLIIDYFYARGCFSVESNEFKSLNDGLSELNSLPSIHRTLQIKLVHHWWPISVT